MAIELVLFYLSVYNLYGHRISIILLIGIYMAIELVYCTYCLVNCYALNLNESHGRFFCWHVIDNPHQSVQYSEQKTTHALSLY